MKRWRLLEKKRNKSGKFKYNYREFNKIVYYNGKRYLVNPTIDLDKLETVM